MNTEPKSSRLQTAFISDSARLRSFIRAAAISLGFIGALIADGAETKPSQPNASAKDGDMSQAETARVVSEDNPSASNGSATDSPTTSSKQNQETASMPQPERLKSKSLGLGFEKFNPSEAISADNAVPFPVDI